MIRMEEFAKRFATLVDAEVSQYEAKKGRKASDYIRRKFRALALDKLKAKWPEEVKAVLGFVDFLSQQKEGRLFTKSPYPSWENTPAEFRPGAEIYAIYRGVLSSRTRYRTAGMDAYRGSKKKNTIIMNGEQPMTTPTLASKDNRKEIYLSILSEVGEATLSEWKDEHVRNHRLNKLIAALSPEDMEALTDLLSQK